LVGEEVEVELTEVRRRFARARLVEVRRASLSGGTALSVLYMRRLPVPACAYAEQLRLKHKQVAEVARLGGFRKQR
jgi:tRNA/tmRNA/rRNA uracil-C5-methylase (TrmA/RlmC/RlmD family)